MSSTTITDIRTVALTVSDQDQAVAFYVGTLGFELRLDAPISPTMRWVEVAPPGATTSLALNLADPTGGARPGADTGIRFVVPDAEVEHAAMDQRGVTVSDVIRWPDVPPMFTAEDPDGNRFYVVEDVS